MQNNDICYLTETWLNDGEVNQFESIFNNYNIFHQSDMLIKENYQLRGRPFGGKCWLLNKRLKVKKVEFINKILSIVKLGVGNDTILLIGAYIPFDDNTTYRFSQYNSTLEFIASIMEDNQDKFILLAGDFNSDLKRGKRFYNLLKDFIIEHDLDCYDLMFGNECKPTYSNGNYTSHIDHIIGTRNNLNKVFKSEIIYDESNLSDHYPVKVEIKDINTIHESAGEKKKNSINSRGILIIL
jgi:exonuclease III